MSKITGKTLIQLGYKQGRWFKSALKYANDNRLEGQTLLNYLDECQPDLRELHESPIPFHSNIEAQSPIEQDNVDKVTNSMYRLMKTPTVINGAIMPDACPTGPAGNIPVGGVVVTKDAIHPSMHSADICCSVMMSSFGLIDPKKVLDVAHSITHFGGGGRKDQLFDLSNELEDEIKGNYYTKSKRSLQLAKSQLGTQGDGNHFLYVGISEQSGETIMVTHHGSRGFGANLYRQGIKAAEVFRKEISPKTMKCNAWIPYSHPQGQEYWEALQIARKWTKLNHEVLHRATSQKLKVDRLLNFWNEHNFVFKDGDEFYHAKGATPLDDKFVPDSYEGLRLVPLNMSEPILVVKGQRSETNLGFAPHGAGRDISRSQHIRNNSDRTIHEIFEQETNGLDIRFYSKHIDISELPSAYKNASNVQKQMEHFGLGEIVDRIMPYGCIMAGDWQKDAPWRRHKKKTKK